MHYQILFRNITKCCASNNPIIFFVCLDKEKIVKIILDFNAFMAYEKNDDGEIPLSLAVQANCKFLKKFKFWKQKYKKHRFNYFCLFILLVKSGTENMTKYLIGGGVNKEGGKYKRTPLHWSIILGRFLNIFITKSSFAIQF